MLSPKSSKIRYSDPRTKIISARKITRLAAQLKSRGSTVVFTNGSFDVLHVGHVRYLNEARNLGDVLVVGLNSDRSVKSYKGPGRPLNPQAERAEVLSSLGSVDFVVIFNDPTPLKLIKAIRPSYLVKGSDWKKNQIAGAQEVESWGGKVRRIRLVPDRSTTRVLSLLARKRKGL